MGKHKEHSKHKVMYIRYIDITIGKYKMTLSWRCERYLVGSLEPSHERGQK